MGARGFGVIGAMTAILVVCTAKTARGQAATSSVPESGADAHAAQKQANQKPGALQGSDGDALSFTSSDGDRHLNSFRTAPKHFLLDQKAMWMSPARIRLPDATWLVPLGGLAAGLFATDTDVSRSLNNAPNTLSHYRSFSNYGVGGMAGAVGGLYFLGLATHNRHQKETGFLSGEAAVDSVIAVEALKYMTRRERPLLDNANGKFWSGGDSFPSEHAAAAWSIASVVADEYPGLLPKVAAYGLASAVSAARVTSKEHFPSDALVGSAIGWLVGQYVYRDHHDPDLEGGGWGALGIRPESPSHWRAKDMGSPYVPLDSWIYPALLRLAALGYVKSDIEGMRPWTRMECARLVEEAGDSLADKESTGGVANQLDQALEKEFSNEINLLGGGNNRAAQLESVYTRVTGISGEPLTDGYHFGQTIVDDYGRPYEEGANNVTGASGWATDGPFVGYFRGEYQHAPSAPPSPLSVREFISTADGGVLPVPPATSISSIDQFALVDGYIGMNFHNWELSFGNQNLWWGPSEGGPMMFTNNAAPVRMARLDRVSPFRLPSILGWFGPIKLQFFFGQLAGHDFISILNTNLMGQWGLPLSRQPFIHGEKFSFKPTSNLEFSVSETTVFAGGPIPLTGHNLLRSYVSFIVPKYEGETDITDARSGVDFTYRFPWLRRWLTFYGDAFTEDEYSPLGYPRKAAFQGGIYVPQIPGVPKLDLRVEGGSTSPADFIGCVGCFYDNNLFINSYTNRGNLMGTWVGRASEGEQAWTTYWLTPRSTVQLDFRHRKIDGQFLPDGGTVTDGSVGVNWWIHSDWNIAGSVQYEKWNIPILAPTLQSNWTTSIEIGFWPKEGNQARQP